MPAHKLTVAAVEEAIGPIEGLRPQATGPPDPGCNEPGA